jgi:hypothetical protein
VQQKPSPLGKVAAEGGRMRSFSIDDGRYEENIVFRSGSDLPPWGPREHIKLRKMRFPAKTECYGGLEGRRYGVIAGLVRGNALFIEPDLNMWRQIAAATDFGDFGLKSRGFTCAILYFMLSLPVRPSASVCQTFLPLPASVFLSISLPSADNCHVILSRDIPSQRPNVGRCGLMRFRFKIYLVVSHRKQNTYVKICNKIIKIIKKQHKLNTLSAKTKP